MWKRLTTLMSRLAREEYGQATTEYILVIGIMAAVLGVPTGASSGIAPVVGVFAKWLSEIADMARAVCEPLFTAARAHGGLAFLADIALLALALACWRRVMSIRLRRAATTVLA